tara:strand:+ start:581 stop:724 length:144 start_codon:yes stop_codon:yes gene_type:complete
MKKLLGNLGLIISLIGLGTGAILLGGGNEVGIYILILSFLSLTFTTK